MNYKKGFIIVGLLNLLLIGAIAIFASQFSNRLDIGSFIQPTRTPTQPVEEALLVTLRTTEGIKAGQEFTLVAQIKNPNSIPVSVKEIVLPGMITSNMQVIGSEPKFINRNRYDVGEGFSYDVVVSPGGEQIISFVIQPVKMQSLNTEVVVYTENFVIPVILQFVVAP